jgi:Lsr2
MKEGGVPVAVRRVVRWRDDLDGSPASETVWFGVDGVGYEVDLSAGNAAALRGLLGRYLAVARPAATPTAAAAGGRVRPAPTRAGGAVAGSTRVPGEPPGQTGAQPQPQSQPEPQPEPQRSAVPPPAWSAPAPAAAQTRPDDGGGAEVAGVRFSDPPTPAQASG